MAHIYPYIYHGDRIIPSEEATLHIASSAVLYGLSVYTVFPILMGGGKCSVFRLSEHLARLASSAQLMGIELPDIVRDEGVFLTMIADLIRANNIGENVFARVTIHVDALVPGTKSRGLHTILSVFFYEAASIVPQDGMRLKTSPWRRNPDFAIPSRAKVNGGYVNSVLAKQDALDSGYDDAIFLDITGHVAELSAANIFIVRDGVLITPSVESDILEGINRRTLLELASDMGIPAVERRVDMTELYIAEEVFVSGTSAFVAPVVNIDGRVIGVGTLGPLTSKLRDRMQAIQSGSDILSSRYLTEIVL